MSVGHWVYRVGRASTRARALDGASLGAGLGRVQQRGCRGAMGAGPADGGEAGWTRLGAAVVDTGETGRSPWLRV